MITIEMTGEERDLLASVLERVVEDMRTEIRHTDHREYKEMLRERERMLEGMIPRMKGETVAP